MNEQEQASEPSIVGEQAVIPELPRLLSRVHFIGVGRCRR